MRAHVWIAGLALVASACKLDSRNDSFGDKNPRRFHIGRAATPAEIAADGDD